MRLCFAGVQRRLKGPGAAVGLFVYCALEHGTKYETCQLGQYSECVCGSSHVARKPDRWRSSVQITGNGENSDGGLILLAKKKFNKIAIRKTKACFDSKVQLRQYGRLIQHRISGSVSEEGEEDMFTPGLFLTLAGVFYIRP